MICSIKQSATVFTSSSSDLFKSKSGLSLSSSSRFIKPRFLIVPSISADLKDLRLNSVSKKPLYVSSVENFGSIEGLRFKKPVTEKTIECKAYEADANVELTDQQTKAEAAQKLKIGVYFATWWALNVVFNIYNKKVLNAFPYPWLTSTLSLAAGSLIMLISWGTRIAEAPKTDLDFWKALFPVALAHTIGHVAATVSMSKVAVSFTHIIKSGEPAFSVLVSSLILGESFPPAVYLSLLPIIGGCALAAVTELNFNMIGFMGAMISNLAFVFRNIFSKKGMKGKSVGGMNYYACLSMLSLLILTPFAIAVEGPQMWAAGWKTAVSQIGPNFAMWYFFLGKAVKAMRCNVV
ncbi:Glucose-6-phosphate/phosphate translocator 2 protein [Thalictrum thalictroides]|uniref:Glucose-6-phosphate/phosphate translocator 2 protein n=1 Tax=Thalictrum thalictroides TaxID=46969 RepID=A0A7J6VA87_THATH|nr:Glucose-6-phosphate/phosphate translocator 2 protein [Thalictrum thalictroides]